MVNIIKNPGFEAEPRGIDWTFVNAAVVYDSIGQTHAAKLNPNGTVSQIITLQPNTTYFLQFDCRPWYSVPIIVNVGGTIVTFPVSSSATYISVTPQTFTTSSSPSNSISFTSADTVFIDRIDLELVSTPATTYDCIDNNCVINPTGTGEYPTLAACVDSNCQSAQTLNRLVVTPIHSIKVNETAQVEVTAYDNNNQALPGISITFSATPPGSVSWSSTTGTTDTNGKASTTVTALADGEVVITVASGAVSAFTTLIITANGDIPPPATTTTPESESKAPIIIAGAVLLAFGIGIGMIIRRR